MTTAPRRVLAALALICVGMLAFGVYLQQVVGLEPCPMCIVQRYCDFLLLFFALLGAVVAKRAVLLFSGLMVLLWSAAGAFVAARQSWLQWHPPEVVSCGRDFYGMIENFPLQRALPLIFKGQWRLHQGGLDLSGRLHCQLVVSVVSALPPC